MRFEITSKLSSTHTRGFSLVLLPLGYLMPLISFGGAIQGAIVWMVGALVEGMLALIGTIFVGITRYILAFPQPTSIQSLSNYYDKMIPLFILVFLLGSATFFVYMQLFPDSTQADPYRLIERGLGGVILVILGKPLFDNAVYLTNVIIRFLMPGSYSLDVVSGGLAALMGFTGSGGGAGQGTVELGLTLMGSLLFAIFAGWSTLITVFFFWIVLAMRMLVVFVVFGLFPLLVAFWIFDMGVMKYSSQAASLAFKVAGFLLVIGILISGILAVGDQVAGQGITEEGPFSDVADQVQGNATNNTSQSSNSSQGGNQAALAASVASGNGGGSASSLEGGQFQSGPPTGEAGNGSSNGSEGNATGGGANNSANASNMDSVNATGAEVAESSGSKAGVMLRIFSYIGSMWLAIALTMSGLGVVISTGSAGSRAGGRRSSGQQNSSSDSGSDSSGSGALTGAAGGAAVMQGGDSDQKGVVHGDGTTETSGRGSVSDGNVTGDQLEDVSTGSMGEMPEMSLRDKGKAAFGGAAAGVAGGVSRATPDKVKDAAQSGSEAVQDVGESVKESAPGQAASWGYEKGAPYAQAAGRTAKGAAKTYGKMFAEEDPVRAAQIGVDGMRRSPIGDPRRSNATGGVKESYLPDSEEEEEATEGAEEADTQGEEPETREEMGPYQSEEGYEEQGYEYSNQEDTGSREMAEAGTTQDRHPTGPYQDPGAYEGSSQSEPVQASEVPDYEDLDSHQQAAVDAGRAIEDAATMEYDESQQDPIPEDDLNGNADVPTDDMDGGVGTMTGDESGDETWGANAEQNWTPSEDYEGDYKAGTEVQYSGERETGDGSTESYEGEGAVLGEMDDGSLKVAEREDGTPEGQPSEDSTVAKVPKDAVDSVRDPASGSGAGASGKAGNSPANSSTPVSDSTDSGGQPVPPEGSWNNEPESTTSTPSNEAAEYSEPDSSDDTESAQDDTSESTDSEETDSENN